MGCVCLPTLSSFNASFSVMAPPGFDDTVWKHFSDLLLPRPSGSLASGHLPQKLSPADYAQMHGGLLHLLRVEGKVPLCWGWTCQAAAGTAGGSCCRLHNWALQHSQFIWLWNWETQRIAVDTNSWSDSHSLVPSGWFSWEVEVLMETFEEIKSKIDKTGSPAT